MKYITKQMVTQRLKLPAVRWSIVGGFQTAKARGAWRSYGGILWAGGEKRLRLHQRLRPAYRRSRQKSAIPAVLSPLGLTSAANREALERMGIQRPPTIPVKRPVLGHGAFNLTIEITESGIFIMSN